MALVDHGGLILLGGEMGAYDDARFAWLTGAKSLVIQSVIQNVPFLGVNLGHQLAAVALGGRVAADPAGPQRGVFPVGLLQEAADDPLMSALTGDARVVHWNSDIVSTVPGGATVLARDPRGHVQILRYAERAWGIQGHPEVGATIVRGWGRTSPEPRSPGEDGTEEAIRTILAQEARLESIWWPVIDRFFAATERPGPGPGGRAIVPLPPPPSRPGNGHIHHR